MTTFTWTINAMYTMPTPEPDYVVNVLWTLTGDQDGTVASMSGNSLMSSEDTTNFIPYDQLTQDIVIGWVQESLGPDGVANCEANVQGQIDSILNPPVAPQNTPLPWASN